MWGPAAGAAQPPAWGLSPLRDESPRGPPAATPGALYRSAFASECEAIVLQLGGGGGRGREPPTPLCCPLTVEAETLTPLEASWSFLAEPSEEPPAPPSEEPPAPPSEAPPSPANRTYERLPSPCGGPAAAPLEAVADDAHRTFEMLPGEASQCFVASTPLPPRVGFFPPAPKEAMCPRGPTFRKAHFGDSARPPPSKGRKSLAAAGAQITTEAASVPGAPGKRSPHTAGTQLASMARPESAEGLAAKSQKLPEERNNLSKLPCSKKSIRPRPSRGTGLLNGLAPPGVGRENKSPGTKLPVRAAAGGNKANQKRPLERRLVKGAATPQKELASKRSCPGKTGRTEKPTGGVLLDAGQLPSATLLSRPAAPCSQCQQLAEENGRLKSMLEKCERMITLLKQKHDENN